MEPPADPGHREDTACRPANRGRGRPIRVWLGSATPSREGAFFANATTLPLGEATPDTEFLGLDDGELQAFDPYLARATNGFRLPSRRTSFRKEQVGVSSATVRIVLPGQVVYG